MTISEDHIHSFSSCQDVASTSSWTDWRWHIRHSVRDIATLESLLGIEFEKVERDAMERTIEKFPMAITPYFLSLIEPDHYRNDPIFRQSVPSPDELLIEEHDIEDPLHEDKDSPVPGITHRYPDRVLFLVSNTCAMYCRHCTRKRRVGDIDSVPSEQEIRKGIEYIRDTPAIRDVLLSGGDPLMLPDDYLKWILDEIHDIPHVEVIRIGSRIPAVLPFRVTDSLLSILRKHHPVWMNVQFNHPREVTPSSCRALGKIADAGIPLGNQSVLLAGVNDCPRIIRALVHHLVKNRVRPYYLYQCDLSEGLSHFRTPVAKGIEIMENLIGHTSGFAVPTYVIDAPGGGGKIPMMPNYTVSSGVNRVVLRNYEGVICTYPEPDTYQRRTCDGDCVHCMLDHENPEGIEARPVGIAKLLADYDNASTLVPADTPRMERRNE